MIGKIVRRPLREVWRHEALDFTTWLVENIDVLSDALDLPLQDAKREQAAGDFSVDLVADDGSGNTVVIQILFTEILLLNWQRAIGCRPLVGSLMW
jgi:hypothetical protein